MKTALENPASNALRSFKTPTERPLVAYIVLSLFAILYFPYFFTVSPSTSDSYVFGYNNRIAHYSLAVPATAQNFQYELWTRRPRS
jgi:hypothetical protein